jgi:hypothetical protein
MDSWHWSSKLSDISANPTRYFATSRRRNFGWCHWFQSFSPCDAEKLGWPKVRDVTSPLGNRHFRHRVTMAMAAENVGKSPKDA